jgi:beta-lactamase regulating signal transducer with metallopeptidase domain
MKHTVRLEPGRFVHLDSYYASHETRLSKICVAALTLIIAALTAGAVVGMDITNQTPTQQHDNTQR